ncbi:hypothetical protein [Chamaesiphon polymorphus]|uniref:NB-ARC domain-containing protein n=1 Tax=Chamaesiphon polymorphus CCALA 037 TaxID=2107692 RepID=A0A2T1FGA7_9CYAN|nr:hypothetical protein [Chamaesiphon polymorphus]PSB44032.1 hypothetical protein C7B77_25870 [Chamaesiphon polymorphus CCALA 037]
MFSILLLLLEVQTAMNAKKSRRRGVVLSLTGQQKLETARRQIEKAERYGDRLTLDELSERTQLAISTITRVLEAQIGVDKLIWRSLRNAPPLDDLLRDLMAFLNPDLSPPVELRHLLQGLQTGRYLVILDNLETLLDAERVGQFRSGYDRYGELLRSIGEVAHQSCVIVTSREKPADVAILEGDGAAVQVLSLGGSADAARAILDDKGLIGTIEERQLLCDRYSNSPLALKIVATSIRDLCNGYIEHFLGEDTFIFNGIRLLLDRHFQRLSAIL